MTPSTAPPKTDDRRILETTQLLGALPPAALDTLRAASTLREVARNEVLFRQGDDATELFGIVSGRIAILTKSPDGRESLVAVLESGALFGELALFDEARGRPTPARSSRPSSSSYPTRRCAARSSRTPRCSG